MSEGYRKMNKNPYLRGNFAPVHDELDVPNLNVSGEIPRDLQGIYLRNGPNPAFVPLSYTYPFDGDGMIHAVTITNGQAYYRNRYVETRELLKERKAGRALYQSILKPAPLEPEWADPEDQPIAFKNGAFIHIIQYAKKYLAMSEGAQAYVMSAELKTLGPWQAPGGKQPFNVGPHTRLDAKTGDLWLINYDLLPPYLTIYQMDKEGKIIAYWDIEKPHSTMIHDFVITENYVIIFDCPIVFDIQQIQRGGAVLNWRPELGTRIGLFSRKNGKMHWLQSEAFFVFHFANAYEINNKIIVDFVKHSEFFSTDTKTHPQLSRTIIDLNSGNVTHKILADYLVEFPRLREDLNGLMHRYIYVISKTGDPTNQSFTALVKYDAENQQIKLHDFGPDKEIGEAVFAPANTNKAEDDGYLLCFVYDKIKNSSELAILDAVNLDYLAQIQMPQRIPHGLHGTWVAQ